MNIDFLHNQIIRDTITQRFIESFNENLVPYLISEYGSSLTDVQFYEDHLTSGFRIDGEFHYPLTLVVDGRAFTRWIKWPVANYRNYDKFNPYTYKGAELLEFELLDEAPEALKGAIAARRIYADDSAMPVVLSSSVGDKTFLAGKFSQSFVDALSRAVTDAIECEFGITGLNQSGVVLELRFMPGTFMEHVVENSTYRRVLIKARGCSPRDLWIKWTRLDGRGTYTISDNADTDEIIFEIADEVPGKIREKEYRYLTAESVEKYQSAMSRKNMTEWREMMRRVIRRGEVERIDDEPKLAITVPKDEEVEEELVEAVPAAIEVQTSPAVEAQTVETDPLAALLASLENQDDEPETDEGDDDLSDLLKTAIGITTAPAAYTSEEDEDTEDEEETEYEEELDEDENDEDEVDESEIEELDDVPVRVSTDSILEDKARLEIEQRIRAELEEELRRKHQEAEELRARLEAQLRAQTREKELMAEAARAAIQEQQRLAKEREEAEARARAEEELHRKERERAEEEARVAKARAEEEARIRAELEAKERARREAEAAAEAAKAAEPEVKYVSKIAKLIFKTNVDPNVTKRIHEIILATIKYYHKEDVYIKIKATIPDSNTVNLEFVKIPENEISLIVNIIKVLGRSDLGIVRATLD